MPSARKRRLRKLIKGALKAKDVVGSPITGDGSPSAQQSAMDSINALEKGPEGTAGTQGHALSTLLGLQVSAGLPTTSNPDSDGKSTGNDFLPFDAREVRDTDGDNIGDNRDILLTKWAIDTIYKSRFDDADVIPATGTLQTEFSSIASQNVAIAAALALGGAAAKTQLGVLQDGASGSSYTIAGQNSLRTSIQGKESSVEALKLEISAMTADVAVAIDDEPFYNAVPYNQAGGSTKAQDDSALTDVATPTTSSEALIDDNIADIDAINNL